MAILERELTEQAPSNECPKRWKITREAYHAMARAGAFAEQKHVELVNGDIYNHMSPIGVQHVYATNALLRLLNGVFLPDDAVIVGSGVNLSDFSEPEPDIIALRGKLDDYRTVQPTARDILLAVEVSMSTLAFDRAQNAAVYSQAGIPEYWIVNLAARQVEIYRDPQSDGAYASSIVVDESGSVSTLSRPEVHIQVSEFLP
jgi:Uma2 family endonuclease